MPLHPIACWPAHAAHQHTLPVLSLAPSLPQLLSQVQLDPSGKLRIAALRSGYLTPPPKELVRAPRKQASGGGRGGAAAAGWAGLRQRCPSLAARLACRPLCRAPGASRVRPNQRTRHARQPTACPPTTCPPTARPPWLAQVVVVVTDDLKLMCLNHNLQIEWEADLGVGA